MAHTKERADKEKRLNFGMGYKFGKSTLFITTNQQHNCSIQVHFLCGNHGGDDNLIPPLEFRNLQEARYPGAQAIFHDHLIDVLVRVILGWDPTNKKPYKSGGLFGFVKAFHGCLQ